MSQRIEKLAILFADICGSTSLYENYGDDLALKIISRCINTMAEKVSAYQGTLVKTIGDEIMASFPSAEAAFHAACEMQVAVENDGLLKDGIPLHIRIGFNYGEVIVESGDVFGNTVNVAARVATITRAGQIMTTRAVFDALPVALRGQLRQIMRAEFLNHQGEAGIYQLVYEQADTTSTQNMRFGISTYRKSTDNADEMTLRCGDQAIKVSRERRSVALGRVETCDVVVKNDCASRLHSYVELRFGKFILVDRSTNGTFIRYGDGNVAHITREEIPLHGNGVISLGQSFDEHPVELIEFSITSTHVQAK